MITLDIFADPACPWCLIGKSRLERALARHPQHPFALAWQPFRLNPTLPREGMDRQAFLDARFGPDAKTINTPVLEAAQAEGIAVDLAAMRREPNTTDAHRLLFWAGLEERQTPVMSALMQAHWCEGRNIGDLAVLADIAGAAGLDKAMIARLLASDADLDTVDQREAHARARGISSVPTFIIGSQYAVSGAQPAEFWDGVIAELVARAAEPASQGAPAGSTLH